MQFVESPESSNIQRFGHCEKTNTLKIEFKHGGTYNYIEVPHKVFESMRRASSKGKFFHQYIRGKYTVVKE